MMEKSPLGAYFYPLTTQSIERINRAKTLNVRLVDETELVKNAKPLYEGHRQPNIYCLGDLTSTTWDDTNKEAMDKQINLALQFGLDFFIFDAYIGTKSGRIVREMNEPLDNSFLELDFARRMEFGLMFALGSPRVILPVPRVSDFSEPDRDYDINHLTARIIIDNCAQNYWQRENYFRINDKPYISFYTTNLGESVDSPGAHNFKKFVEFIYDYSHREYKIDPYVVGIVRTESDAKIWENAGVDALTGYAYLPDFGSKAPPIQLYHALLREREAEWQRINDRCLVPFIPSAVVGWDGSPRGEQGFKLEEVIGYYPYTPIIEGSTPEVFRKMLEDTLFFARSNIPTNERYNIICAWNEISEGCSLLPRVEGNIINFSYLEMVKRVLQNVGKP